MSEEEDDMEIEDIDFRSILITTGKLRNFVKKGWGYELILHNDDLYCGKMLHIDQGAKFSMHYHVERHKTWYVSKGKLVLKSINVDTTEPIEVILNKGDVVEVFAGVPHQLQAIEESEIFEVSTEYSDEDTFRIGKGDSLK